MNRIQIQVDIKDNEVFEESVQEAIKAQARQIARDVIEQEIRQEIERIVSSKISDLQTGRYSRNSIQKQITENLAQAISTDIKIDVDAIKKHVENTTTEMLQRRFLKNNDIDNYIQKYLNNTLINILKEKI